MRNKIVLDDLEFIINNNLPWEKLRNKTVLITGANGFLPSYLVETLIFLNEKRHYNISIIGLVRNKKKAYQRFSEYINQGQLQLIVQDVCASLNRQYPVHYIIHAASQASPKYYGIDPVGTINANVVGSYNLLEFSKKCNIEGFLFISSGEVYGEVTESQIPTKEGDYGYVDPANVRSCYCEGKRAAETMCIAYHHQFGIPIKIARPYHTYGPGMNLDDGRVFADFVANVVNKKDIVMKSDGRATRAFCYLADATIGFFKVLLQGDEAEVYNVGNDKAEISIIELANILVSLFPEFALKVIVKKNDFNKGYIKSKISRACPSIEKLSSIGWRPSFTIEEGFRRTIRSYL